MQSYDKFLREINALLNSNFLSSGNIIRRFLVFLANDSTCREILHVANGQVNLTDELIRVFDEKQGLPQSPEKVVAVVTNVLYSLDTAKITLTAVLGALYNNKPSDEAYKLFLEEIIVPYSNCFLKLIKGEPIEEFSAPKQTVLDKMNEDIKSVVREMKSDLAVAKIPSNGGAVIAKSLDGLVYSLQFSDPVLTRYGYDAFLNALRLFDVKADFADDLTKIFKLYGVL